MRPRSARFLFRAASVLAVLAVPAEIHAQHPGSTIDGLPTAEQIAKLPTDGGPEFNRLIFEKSPYLLQHARNPVKWFAWGDAAFETAKKDGKPVFLSIGYSTCHWCHVMEHESFEDAEVAKLLNDRFVAIKVDREEHPEIDAVYMTFCQAMTGSGGWPLTIVMTPDKQPFFAGTYLPKRGTGGRAGLIETLTMLADSWGREHDAVVAHADKLAQQMRAAFASTPADEPGVEVLEQAFRDLSGTFDEERGGFGRAPKFPIPTNLRFLLRWNARSGDAKALTMVERTIAAMAAGGIHDHVGYGFHRYSTDRDWLVPHFEKMLYDQALIATALCETYIVDRDPRVAELARTTFAYVLRDLTSPAGAFYCSEDADSSGFEGLFYLWTRAELAAVLGNEDGDFAANLYGVVDAGNMREEVDGELRSVLYLPIGGTDPALATRIEGIRKRLFDAREKRVHPLKDDKVLVDWNGLMISALAIGARALDEPSYAAAAHRAVDFIEANMRAKDGRLLHRFRAGDASIPAVLDDYAFLCEGCIDLYETDFDARDLVRARTLADEMIARCGDDAGGFFLAAKDGEVLPLGHKDAYDGAIPSGNSVAVRALLRLARLTGETKYEDRVHAALKAFSREITRQPSAHTEMLLAIDHEIGPALEIVVAGKRGAPDTQAMLSVLRARLLPNAVVLLKSDGDAALDKVAPWTAGYHAIDGKAAAYVCSSFTCQAPVTDPEALRRALAPPPAAEKPR